MKYKKGDRVICVDGHNRRRGGGSGWREGFEFTITDISGDVLWGGYGGNGVYAEYVRPFENKLNGWYTEVGELVQFKDMTREQLIIALSECYRHKDGYQSSKAISLEKELVKRLQA